MVAHHSCFTSSRRVLLFKSYLDDSGTEELSPSTVIGGPVLTLFQLPEFNKSWKEMLRYHHIPPPLHMVDFVRPYGKHIGMHREMKIALFNAVAKTINEHKSYSISVSVPQVDFRERLSPEVCKTVIGPYALAFFSTVVANRRLPEILASRPGPLAGYIKNVGWRVKFVIDRGSAHSDQLVAAHDALRKWEQATKDNHFTGTMAFDNDEHVLPLQAADVIAWSARRRETQGPLENEFEPLNAVLDEHAQSSTGRNSPHTHIRVPLEAIADWARPIDNWIRLHGELPRLQDIVR